MTSDAKIGLLLGLFFIFVIAFIINGLPNFKSESDSNELTTNMVGSRNKTLGLASMERKAHQIISPVRRIEQNPVRQSRRLNNNENVRFETPLPNGGALAEQRNVNIDIKPAKRVVRRPDFFGEAKPQRVKAVAPARPMFYVVSEGDSLAGIAKKFYGSQEGNRKINIERIFKANNKLSSADEIFVGQKLLIPPLPASLRDSSEIKSVFAGKIFEKVDSIGRRVLSARTRQTRKSNWYVVKENDSLWKIANSQLGDGNRYTEIARLNADILEDEDALVVGMRLKMPAR